MSTKKIEQIANEIVSIYFDDDDENYDEKIADEIFNRSAELETPLTAKRFIKLVSELICEIYEGNEEAGENVNLDTFFEVAKSACAVKGKGTKVSPFDQDELQSIISKFK